MRADTQPHELANHLRSHGLKWRLGRPCAADASPSTTVSIQDRQDARGWKLFGSERVCAYRYRAVLCGQGYQQATHGRKGTHGESPHGNGKLGAYTGQVRNEIAVLKRVSMGHRNILTLVDYFETMNNRRQTDQPSGEFSLIYYQYTWSPILLWEASYSIAYVAKATTTNPMQPI